MYYIYNGILVSCFKMTQKLIKPSWLMTWTANGLMYKTKAQQGQASFSTIGIWLMLQG